MAIAYATQTPAHTEYPDLVGEHFYDLWHVAQWLTDTTQDAQDLFQDTLVAGYRALDALAEDTDIRHRLLKQMCDICQTRGWDPAPGCRPPTAAEADPDSEADQRLVQAMRTLPPWLRMPLVLSDVAGLCYDEIARVLGLPLGAVRSRIYRGRQELTELLQPSNQRTADQRLSERRLRPTFAIHPGSHARLSRRPSASQ